MSWNPLSWIPDLLTTAADKVGDYFIRDKEMEAADRAGKLRIKEAKVNAEIARWEAKAAREAALTKAEIDWDAEALRQMQYSWKDEFLLVAVWVPILWTMFAGILDGLTAGVAYVDAASMGWEALDLVPQWYQWSALGILAATFGLRWLVQHIIPSWRGSTK